MFSWRFDISRYVSIKEKKTEKTAPVSLENDENYRLVN